jgi:hypothetical protein
VSFNKRFFSILGNIFWKIIKVSNKNPKIDHKELIALKAITWIPRKNRNIPIRFGCLLTAHGPVLTILVFLKERVFRCFSLLSSRVMPKRHITKPSKSK